MNQHIAAADYPRFHLAFPVTDLARARDFYGRYLGCAEGRSSDAWVDFDFFGHQIVAHKVASAQMSDATSLVDGDNVPVRHFGVVLSLPGVGGAGGEVQGGGAGVRHRAARPLSGRAGRAGDDVLPRSVRQRARVQGVRRPRPPVRQVDAEHARPHAMPRRADLHAAATDATLAQRALARAGASDAMARATARALVAAEAQGLVVARHVARAAIRAAPAQRSRRRQRRARDRQEQGCGVPGRRQDRDSRFRRAHWRWRKRCAVRASFGVAFAGVTNSHHFGVAAYHLLPVADAGMVGLAFGNSPAAMSAAGGKRPLFGTNPDCRRVSARVAAAVVHRPVAVGSRARQGDGGGEARASRFRWAGRSTVTGRRRPTRRPRSTARCCRWAAPRARCWR